MVIDGGIITVPLTLFLVGVAVAAVGGAATGCYAATGSATCTPGPPTTSCHLDIHPYLGRNVTDAVTASWKPVYSASVTQTVTLRASKQRSHEWAKSVEDITSSPAAQFMLDAIGGVAWYLTESVSAGLAIASPPKERNSFSTSYVLLTSEADALEVTCPAGVVWQWQLEVSTSRECAGEPELVGTNNVRCTPNANTPPCCLPGFESSPSDPHGGGCLPDPSHRELETRLSSELCAETLLFVNLGEEADGELKGEGGGEEAGGEVKGEGGDAFEGGARGFPLVRRVGSPLKPSAVKAGDRERHLVRTDGLSRGSSDLGGGMPAALGAAIGVGIFLGLTSKRRRGVAVL